MDNGQCSFIPQRSTAPTSKQHLGGVKTQDGAPLLYIAVLDGRRQTHTLTDIVLKQES